MKKGTIIYYGNFELPDKNAAAHRVLNNAKIFDDLGYKIIFIGINKETETFKHYRIENFEVYEKPYPKNIAKWIEHMADTKILYNTISMYDNVKLVICYNSPTIATWRMKKILSKDNIKIIGDYTEWYGGTKIKSFRQLISKLDTELRMRVIAKKLDGLIVISDFLKKFYFEEEHVLVVPPLVDTSDEIWNSELITRSHNKINFIFAGSTGQKDRIDEIIKAFSIVNKKNLTLTIIGVTKEDVLQSYGEKLGKHIKILHENLVFLGRIPHKDTIRHILSADIFIFFRYKTKQNLAGFPTKFVEATSCRIPVVTTDVGEISSYITSGINGILTPDFSQDQLVNILNNINTEEVLKMKREIDSKKFDYKNYVSVFDEWLEKLHLE